jgi:hypothetical protein
MSERKFPEFELGQWVWLPRSTEVVVRTVVGIDYQKKAYTLENHKDKFRTVLHNPEREVMCATFKEACEMVIKKETDICQKEN